MAPNKKQSEAWTGGESVHHVAHADRYDRQLAPFTEALLEQVRLTPHRSVLDVGCGRGALTLAAARIADSAVGVEGRQVNQLRTQRPFGPQRHSEIVQTVDQSLRMSRPQVLFWSDTLLG